MQSIIYIDGKKVDKDKLKDIEITNDKIKKLISGFMWKKSENSCQ